MSRLLNFPAERKMEKKEGGIFRVKSQSFRSGAGATTSIFPSSPSSGGESPTNPTSTLPTSSPRRRRSKPLINQTPSKILLKQHSAEDLHIRGSLWPSAKTNVVSATLQDHLINDRKKELEDYGRQSVSVVTHAASTFSSRQRAPSDSPTTFEINNKSKGRRGRRQRPSLSSIISNKKKQQPRTPHSPSSSSSSSSFSFSFSGHNISFPAGRLPASDENAHAKRRSDLGLDLPSTESERSEPKNSRSRAPIKVVIRGSVSPVRRSKSPVQRNSRSPPVLHNSRSPVLRWSKSPPANNNNKGTIGGGMGNIISMGLESLFRRKSYSGSGITVASTVTSKSSSAKEPAIIRRGMAEGAAGSPARVLAQAAAVELQHELRMAHNHLIQWRFLNGRRAVVNTNNWTTAQKALVSAWLRLSELQVAVAQKRLQLANYKLSIKLNTLISPQMKAMERWGNSEKQHMAAISSTRDSLNAAVCRLPLTERAKADPQILSILLQKASNLMAAINGNIANCGSMAQRTVPLAAELAQLISKETPLIEECFELLELVSKLQFREESLRCHLIQFKSLKCNKRSLLD